MVAQVGHISCIPTGRNPTGNGGAQGHEHHGGDGILEADGAAEVAGQVTGHGREHADERDGDDETGPAVPVLGGWHEGEQNLPEDGEEVHDVIETRGELLFSTLAIIIVIP